MTAQDRRAQRKVIADWRDSARRDWQSARDIFAAGHYDWSLFIAQLLVSQE